VTGALTAADCRFILESLDFTEQKFQKYPYHTPDLRRERLSDVRSVILKVRAFRDELKASERAG
jgi:hypothetical protein